MDKQISKERLSMNVLSKKNFEKILNSLLKKPERNINNIPSKKIAKQLPITALKHCTKIIYGFNS
jgi:hypothetical protein